LWRHGRREHDLEALSPRYGDRCGVLRHQQALQDAQYALDRTGLPHHPDPAKDWDSLHALATVLSRVEPGGRVLDTGTAGHGPLLLWLAMLGWKDLVGRDPGFASDHRLGPIYYQKAGVLDGGFPDGQFDAITCLSTVRDGIRPALYAKEMHRLLKPGGVLVTSMHYWPHPIDASSVRPPMKIFDKSALLGFIDALQRAGLHLVKNMDTAVEEPVAHAQGTGTGFTFAIVTATKT
jgi:SAM-dependent methyltransferase